MIKTTPDALCGDCGREFFSLDIPDSCPKCRRIGGLITHKGFITWLIEKKDEMIK